MYETKGQERKGQGSEGAREKMTTYLTFGAIMDTTRLITASLTTERPLFSRVLGNLIMLRKYPGVSARGAKVHREDERNDNPHDDDGCDV